MANEITLSAAFSLLNGIDKDSQSFSSQFDQTGTDSNDYTLTVTDAGWTALGKGNIGSLGLYAIRNMSSTAADIVYVSFNDGTTEHLQLGPKAWTIGFLRTNYDIATLKIKAATGKTVLVRVWLKEA
jgi:hypothetical protein